MRRFIDIGASPILLALLSPVFALAAIAVKLSSDGPVIYRAERVGRGGRLFRMLKFRTMVVAADRIGPGITAVDDPRVTAAGRLLRATKIDELPQLVNVLKGEMTLIGPRAEAPAFVKHYSAEQRRLLDVAPGMTGPGQLHYGTDQQARVGDVTRAEEVYITQLLDQKLKLDLEYIDRRGLGQDLRILLATGWFVTSGLVRASLRIGRGGAGTGARGGAESPSAAPPARKG